MMMNYEEFEKIMKACLEHINEFGKKGITFTEEEEQMFSLWKEKFINDGNILNLDFNFAHNEPNVTNSPSNNLRNFACYIAHSTGQKLSFEIFDAAIKYVYTLMYYLLTEWDGILNPGEELIDIAMILGSYTNSSNKQISMEVHVILTDKRIIAVKSYPDVYVEYEIVLEPGESRKASSFFGKMVSIATNKRLVIINLEKLLEGKPSLMVHNLDNETPKGVLIVPTETFLGAPQNYSIIAVTDKNAIVYENYIHKEDCKPTIIPMDQITGISWRMVEREVKVLLVKKKVEEPYIMIQARNLYGYKFVKSHTDRVEGFITRLNSK